MKYPLNDRSRALAELMRSQVLLRPAAGVMLLCESAKRSRSKFVDAWVSED